MPAPLTADQEALAQELLPLLRNAVDEELLALARLLACTDEAHTFGQTEFRARDILLHAGAKAYQTFLAQKKTATGVARSTARTADKLLPSTATDPRTRCVCSARSRAAGLTTTVGAVARAAAPGIRRSV